MADESKAAAGSDGAPDRLAVVLVVPKDFADVIADMDSTAGGQLSASATHQSLARVFVPASSATSVAMFTVACLRGVTPEQVTAFATKQHGSTSVEPMPFAVHPEAVASYIPACGAALAAAATELAGAGAQLVSTVTAAKPDGGCPYNDVLGAAVHCTIKPPAHDDMPAFMRRMVLEATGMDVDVGACAQALDVATAVVPPHRAAARGGKVAEAGGVTLWVTVILPTTDIAGWD